MDVLKDKLYVINLFKINKASDNGYYEFMTLFIKQLFFCHFN